MAAQATTAYFKAFMRAHGFKDGDKWTGYEYIAWINSQHRKFRKLIGISDYAPYTAEQEREFIEFLERGDRA